MFVFQKIADGQTVEIKTFPAVGEFIIRTDDENAFAEFSIKRQGNDCAASVICGKGSSVRRISSL